MQETLAHVLANHLPASMALPTTAGGADPSKRKHRCWQFHLCGIRNSDTKAHEAALASFRGAYTAAKRLTVSQVTRCRDETEKIQPRRGNSPGCIAKRGSCLVVEVQFSGPQSAERPALLLHRLFQAGSVAVHPVALRRGRKRCSPAVDKDLGGEKDACVGDSVEVPASSGNKPGNTPLEEQNRTGAAANPDSTETIPDVTMHWSRARKRSASGANLPTSRTDLRLEEEDEGIDHYGGGRGEAVDVSDSCGHRFDDEDLDDDDIWNFAEEGEEDSAFAAYTGSLGRTLLCGAWSRCVDPLPWVAADEESDAAMYDRGALLTDHRRRRRRRANNEASAHDSDSDHGTESAAASLKKAAAALSAGYWTDIDLDTSGRGEQDGAKLDGDEGGSGILSPLTVTSPFLRIAPDTDALRCNAVTALTGSLRVSPLTVQAPPPLPATGRRRTRSFFDNDQQRQHEGLPRSRSDVTLAVTTCGGGGAPVALRAPWHAGGVACVPEGEETGGAARERDAGPGGGSPAPPSCLGQAEAGAGGAASHDQQRGGVRSQRVPAKTVELAVEPLHEEYDFEGRAAQLEEPTDSPFEAAFSMPPIEDDEQHLVFLNLLEGTGQPLRALSARARFSVSAGRKADREIGPLQAATNGRVYGVVQYPSMNELWPDVYNTTAVRAVEVNLCVEVRSLHQKELYLRQELKVMYRRQKVGKTLGATWRP
eukprot:g3401.t1